MITKEITNEKGTFTVIIHSATSVGVRNENLTVNKIPYNVHTSYDVKDMIFTESYRFVSRRDSYSKEATFEQKNRISEVMKSEVFNYIFYNPELLIEGQKNYVNQKMASMERERDELMQKAYEKQNEIEEFWETRRAVFQT